MPSFKEDEVVLIRKRPASESDTYEYEVFSLVESEGEGEGKGNTNPLFRLAREHVSVADLQSWPGHRGLVVEQVPEYLRSGGEIDGARAVHVLVSTGSGTGRAVVFYDTVLAPLLRDALGLEAVVREEAKGRRNGLKDGYNLVITTDAQSIRRFAAQDLAVDDTVIVLGGDGGVVEILNGRPAPSDDSDKQNGLEKQSVEHASAPLLALLPLGTGNALFHSLHKPLRAGASDGAGPSGLVQGLRTLFCAGAAAPLPSFVARFSPGSRLITYGDKDKVKDDVRSEEEHSDAVSSLRGAIVASYGFHSQLVWESDTPAYRKHGAKRFGMVARELLGESHVYDAVVEVDDNGNDAQEPAGGRRVIPREQHAYYVLATLVSNLERTFAISPASRPLDGVLRLVHFGDEAGGGGGEGIMSVMGAAYDDGRHVKMPGVGYGEVARVTVTISEEDPRWRKVCIDGTIVEIPIHGSMSVAVDGKTRLRVLVDRSLVP